MPFKSFDYLFNGWLTSPEVACKQIGFEDGALGFRSHRAVLLVKVRRLIFLVCLPGVCAVMSAEVGDRGDCHNLVFSIQIGLEREAVTVALGGSAEFTMSTLTEIACAFVDRKVSLL